MKVRNGRLFGKGGAADLLVNDDILPFYRKSISDWKNEYVPECQACARRAECGGFFASGVQHGYSKQLKPFAAL